MEQIPNRLILFKKILQKAVSDLIFHPKFLREFCCQEQKDVRLYMAIYHLYSRTLQMNWTILLHFRYLEQKARHFHWPKNCFRFYQFHQRQRVYIYFKLFSNIFLNRAVNPSGYLVIMLHTFYYFSFTFLSLQWF